MKTGTYRVLLVISLFFCSDSLVKKEDQGEIPKKLKHAQGFCDMNVREAKTSLWIAEKDLHSLRHLGLNTKNKEWRIENLKRGLNKKEIDCYGQPV